MITGSHDTSTGSVGWVAGRIRAFIVEHSLKPGDKLPTHEALSRKLGIGLRRLREGLGVLEQHGVIRRNRKAGTTVGQPTVEALAEPLEWNLQNMDYTYGDLVKARAGIESAAAAEAARERTARDILILLDALEQMQELQRRHEPDDAAEEAFHTGILHATHNPVFAIFGKLIQIQLRQSRKKHPGLVTGDPRRLAMEHEGILRAIEGRKPALAGQRAYQHLIRQLECPPGRRAARR